MTVTKYGFSSFLYQKFTMKLRNKKKSQGEAPKS